VDYKAGTVHLSSSNGMLLEVPESKLSMDDLNYLRSQEAYKKEQRKVTSNFFRLAFRSLI